MKLTSLTLHPARSQQGFAVLALLAFLAIMTLLCFATTRSVLWTRNEMRLIEKKQIARLAASTNSPAASDLTATK